MRILEIYICRSEVPKDINIHPTPIGTAVIIRNLFLPSFSIIIPKIGTCSIAPA